MTVAGSKYITPNWHANPNTRAYSTTRVGGVGKIPFSSFNLGTHVGDVPDVVTRNRELLKTELRLPSEPRWLNQVHGTDVIHASSDDTAVPTADAAWTDQVGCVLAVMTADCVPVIFSSSCGHVVAVAHAGWRGLVGGVLDKTIAALPVRAMDLHVWMGPAISSSHFEVGEEVLDEFTKVGAQYTVFFKPSMSNSGKYFADLFGLCRQNLEALGVQSVHGGEHCSYGDKSRFFSHRRDGGVTGRMATLIWVPSNP